MDAVRLRRLAVGYAAGAFVMTGSLSFVALAAVKAYGLDEDQIVEAAIVDAPDEEPRVEEQPLPEQPKEKPKPRVQALVAPTEVSDKLTEKEPVSAENPYGGDDPYALMEQGAAAPEPEKPKVVEAPKIIDKPKVVPVPKSTEPLRVTEDITPPRAIAMPAPSYPADAKAAGIEGTVVVKYVVTEQGEVTNVVAVRGPDELKAVCEATVKTWRFMPAEKEGKAVAVQRVARFPFRIKT